MDSNNSKLILAIAGAVVVIGGFVAVRNLTSPAEKSDKIEMQDDQKSEADSGDDSTVITSNDTSARVKPIDSQQNNSQRRQSDRAFNRGESAAKIDVTPATTTTAQAAMAAQIAATVTSSTEESADNGKAIADLASRFASETDPDVRIDIADELGLIDDPASIRKILELLKTENDPTVQTALLEALQGLDALEQTSPEVLAQIKDIYANTTDPDVRIAAQDVLGDLGTAESVAALRDMTNNAQADPQERLNAAENMMRIRAIDPSLVPAEEVAALSEQLKQDYQSGPDAAYRSQAIMALAIDGKANLPFFQQALQSEQDPQLKQLLERLVRMFSAPPAATPPPGTAVTPAPTPA